MVTETGENLALLLSLPRSGSTLLSVLLGSHSQILAPPEPWFLLPLLHLDQPGNWFPDFGGGHAALATREFLGDIGFRELARKFAADAYNRVLQQAGKRYILDKTPRYYHIAERLESFLPDAQRIWLLRHPFDIAASFKSTWNIPVAELCGKPQTQHSFDFLVGLPRIAAVCRKPGRNDILVRYENLVSHSSDTIRSVLEKLDLPFEAATAVLDPAQPTLATHRKHQSGDRKIWDTKSIHRDSVGAWKTQLNQDELSDLSKIISQDLLNDLGYGDTIEALRERRVSMTEESNCAARRRTRTRAPKLNLTAVADQTKLADLAAQLEQTERRLAAKDLELRKVNAASRAEVERIHLQLTQSCSNELRLGTQLQDRERRLAELDAELRKQNELSHIEIGRISTELADALNLVNALSARVQDRDRHLGALDAELKRLNDCSRDEIARKEQVIQRRQEENQLLRGQVEELTKRINIIEPESQARWEQIQTLTDLVSFAQTESLARYDQIQTLTKRVLDLQRS